MKNGYLCAVLPLVATLAVTAATSAVAQTKIGAWSDKVRDAWWKKNMAADGWAADQAAIVTQLQAVAKKQGVIKALTNRNFSGWMEHAYWLSLWPTEWQKDNFFSTAEGQKAFAEIGRDDELRELFVNQLNHKDDADKALKILCQIYQKHSKEMRDFGALAVAFAVVHDQPFPEGWPHAFVEKKSLMIGKETPLERFEFYLKMSAEKKLILDIRKMSPNDLKFVVDTPVELMELRRLHNVRISSARQFEQLFHVVRYDEPRLQQGKYVWPHGQYAVATINKKGGLCVDQAYFASHTAKAKGVPSIVFMGQGNSGAHAWLGVLKSYSTWDFDLAKFRHEKYPVGITYDPQSWQKLTDSECVFLQRRSMASEPKARQYMRWATMQSDSKDYVGATKEARRIARDLIEAWEMEALKVEAYKPKEQLKFWDEWVRNFTNQKDLKFIGQKRILALLESMGDKRRYNELLNDIVRTNKSQREDLVVKVAAETIFMLVNKGKWIEADKAFEKTMQKLRSKSGGTLFYNLVDPYVKECLDEGKTDYAKSAMKRVKRSFEAQAGSILDQDIKRLDQLVQKK